MLRILVLPLLVLAAGGLVVSYALAQGDETMLFPGYALFIAAFGLALMGWSSKRGKNKP
jgi:hypothetical protein